MPLRQLCVLCLAASLSACDGPQSALATAGRDAADAAKLFNVMTVGALIVWVAVVAIAVYTIRVGESHTPRAANLLIIGGGVVAPTVVLAALIAYGMPLVPTMLEPGAENGLSIRVTAKQWWWRIQYRTPGALIETANELRLPVGERVELTQQLRLLQERRRGGSPNVRLMHAFVDRPRSDDIRDVTRYYGSGARPSSTSVGARVPGSSGGRP